MVVKMNRLDRLPAGVDPRVPSPYCMRHCFLQQPALLTPGNDCKISAGSKPPFVVRHVSPKFLLIFNVAAGNIYGERERKEERRGWKRRGKREERERESKPGSWSSMWVFHVGGRGKILESSSVACLPRYA